MTFIPDQPDRQEEAPYFEDVTKQSGWAGFATTKSISTLISEVTVALGRLGGVLTDIQSGTFLDEKTRKRPGYAISYFYKTYDGKQMVEKIEVEGLPMRNPSANKEKQVRQMVLFLLRDTLEGYWYMQQLSPGFMALMPFMLTENGITFSQKFSQGLSLPAPVDNDTVDGEITEMRK
jgi:hypothetical protein